MSRLERLKTACDQNGWQTPNLPDEGSGAMDWLDEVIEGKTWTDLSPMIAVLFPATSGRSEGFLFLKDHSHMVPESLQRWLETGSLVKIGEHAQA